MKIKFGISKTKAKAKIPRKKRTQVTKIEICKNSEGKLVKIEHTGRFTQDGKKIVKSITPNPIDYSRYNKSLGL